MHDFQLDVNTVKMICDLSTQLLKPKLFNQIQFIVFVPNLQIGLWHSVCHKLNWRNNQ